MGAMGGSGSVSEEARRTVVVVGVTGAGKSTTCNTISGTHLFIEDDGLTSSTSQAEHADAMRDGLPIRVIDTVGFLSNVDAKDMRANKFGQFAQLTSYGVDAFLLVERYGRWTDAQDRHFELFAEHAGQEAMKHTVLVFTHSNGKDLKRQLEGEVPVGLRKVINKVAGVVGIDNKLNQRAAVVDLSRAVRELVGINRGVRYSNETIIAAQDRREALQARIKAVQNPHARTALGRMQLGLSDGTIRYEDLMLALKRAEAEAGYDSFPAKIGTCCSAVK